MRRNYTTFLNIGFLAVAVGSRWLAVVASGGLSASARGGRAESREGATLFEHRGCALGASATNAVSSGRDT